MKDTLHVKMLAEYLQKNLRKGYTAEALKWALINQGYQKVSIEKAFELANKEMAKQAPILKEKPVITREIINDQEEVVEVKKPWWKRLFGL